MQATSTSRIVEQPAPAVALESAEKAARRARRNAQVRIRFISRAGEDQAPPPLARMLRGGRGGQVRLKLYLSYLWMQTDEHGVPLAFPAQVWAQLLGLPHPEGAGARRIHEAQGWLERNGFITVQSRPGHANRVTVLTETADKGPEPYLAPGAGARALRNTSDIARHLYIQIPAAFWTNGYMALLSGAGLALYLILLDQYGPRQLDDNPHPVWFSPKTFRDRYALSEDTRAKGIDDLLELGLVSVTRQPINPDDFDLVRLRNAYTLQPATLSTPAVRRSQPKPVLDQAASEEPPLVALDAFERRVMDADLPYADKAAAIQDHRDQIARQMAELGITETPTFLKNAVRRYAGEQDTKANRDTG